MPKGDTILKAQPMDYSKVNYLLGYVIHTFNRSQLLLGKDMGMGMGWYQPTHEPMNPYP